MITLAIRSITRCETKQYLINKFKKEYTIIDRGTFSNESVDYADFIHPVAYDVENGGKIRHNYLWQWQWCCYYRQHQKIRAALC
ncbi:MAG: RpiB/LacA/LacB family sugar-phosphate isomerase [Saprospiraceae bacterium]